MEGMKDNPKPEIIIDGNFHKEKWKNGGQYISFCGNGFWLSALSPTGKLWSKTLRQGIHNGSWKSDSVIRRQGKEWIWSMGEDGPVWIPYQGEFS